MKRALSVALLACACLVSSACDGIGRPVVARFGDGMSGACGHAPPTCAVAPLDAAERMIPAPQVEVDMRTCGDVRAATERRWALSPGAAMIGATSATCQELRFEAGPTAVDGMRVTLRDAAWSDVNVAIASTRPMVLELERATLTRVFVRIEGPVTLRVSGDSALTDVRVASEAAAPTGHPRLELVEIDAQRLQIGSDDSPFDGTMHFTRVDIDGARITAGELVAESTHLRHAALDVSSLVTADIVLSLATVTVDTALVSASAFGEVEVSSCGALTFVDSRLAKAQIPACDAEPLRLYDTGVSEGYIAGRIEADGAALTQVAIGAGSDSSVVAWFSLFDTVTFCAPTTAAHFGWQTTLRCSACDSGARAGVLETCRVPEADVLLQHNACAELTTLPDCAPPLDERSRP